MGFFKKRSAKNGDAASSGAAPGGAVANAAGPSSAAPAPSLSGSLTERSVIECLRRVTHPAQGRDVIDLGLVSNIKIGGGNVSFDLQISDAASPATAELRASCADAVRNFPGVGHVSVNVTSKTRSGEASTRQVMPLVKNVIAIASGKGGVGKSTTAVNLAVALKQKGASVGILDADIYGPSVPTMMNIENAPRSMPDQNLEPATSMGIRLISMAFFMPKNQAAILRGPMVSGYVTQFIQRVVWGELDYLIIDYPPGTGDIQLTLSQQAPLTGAVIVTTPQEVALADVRRAVSMFETTGVPVLGVCETMSYFICDQCEKRHHIFKQGGGEAIAKSIGVPFLGGVPIDPRVTEGGDEGIPIVKGYPDSPVAMAYREIAGAAVAQLDILEAERGNYLQSFQLEWAR